MTGRFINFWLVNLWDNLTNKRFSVTFSGNFYGTFSVAATVVGFTSTEPKVKKVQPTRRRRHVMLSETGKESTSNSSSLIP